MRGSQLAGLFHAGKDDWNNWVNQHKDGQVYFESPHFQTGLSQSLFFGENICSFDGYIFPSGGVYFSDLLMTGSCSFAGAKFLGGQLGFRNVISESRTAHVNLSDCEFDCNVSFHQRIGVEIDACGAVFNRGLTISEAHVEHRFKAFN